MARDYKHRAHRPTYEKSRRRQKKASVSFWRLLVVAVLIVAFVVGLNKMSEMVKELLASSALTKPIKEEAPTKQALAIQPAVEKSAPAPVPANPEPVKAAEPEEPRYDFYTILPQAEVVVPDYEIKTRVREEMVGKAKTTKYIMQAGSFRDMPDAEKHKAKLAQLGIQSRIESAKVGNVMWHRIKIGPYDNSTSVSTIKDLLAKNGIGVIVTEASATP